MRTVLTGWYVGYVIAAAVIVIVVGLVGWLLALARRIGIQAGQIVDAIADVRATTAPIPLVAKLNQKLLHVVEQAGTARMALLSEEQS